MESISDKNSFSSLLINLDSNFSTKQQTIITTNGQSESSSTMSSVNSNEILSSSSSTSSSSNTDSNNSTTTTTTTTTTNDNINNINNDSLSELNFSCHETISKTIDLVNKEMFENNSKCNKDDDDNNENNIKSLSSNNKISSSSSSNKKFSNNNNNNKNKFTDLINLNKPTSKIGKENDLIEFVECNKITKDNEDAYANANDDNANDANDDDDDDDNDDDSIDSINKNNSHLVDEKKISNDSLNKIETKSSCNTSSTSLSSNRTSSNSATNVYELEDNNNFMKSTNSNDNLNKDEVVQAEREGQQLNRIEQVKSLSPIGLTDDKTRQQSPTANSVHSEISKTMKPGADDDGDDDDESNSKCSADIMISKLAQSEQIEFENEQTNENDENLNKSLENLKFDLIEKQEELAMANNTSRFSGSSTLIKRTHLKNLIYELYNSNGPSEETSTEASSSSSSKPIVVLIESYMEKLPPGKNLKNSLLLAWKKRYFSLNTIGMLNVYDIDEKGKAKLNEPIEVYNLMGGRVTYEQNKVISLDDGRGGGLVFRCCPSNESQQTPKSSNSPPSPAKTANEDAIYLSWKQAIDSQIVDRANSLWVTPNKPLIVNNNNPSFKSKQQKPLTFDNKKVLIVDIGTCSIRAGLFNNEPKLPKIFVPTVCARDLSCGLKVGFEAFDSLLASSAPSTIDLNRAASTWSLTSNSSSHLIFPLKNKASIDKLNVELECIDSIVNYVVETLNLFCPEHQILIITPQKFSDKLNIELLNLLLSNDKYQFESAMLMSQTLMTLYSYNSTVGIVANLGEKINIVPFCNGVAFQSGVTNLVYGGSVMSEYLNSYISRGHVSYVNDMEQYFVRYVKEKTCYAALNYKDELNKYSNDSVKYTLELTGQTNEFKRIEFPESARFKSVEGLFNPEIWGIDGQGIHKLIHKAIQSSSMDLRREMARSIYLCGGMSRIPGLVERLEKELKSLLPPALTVKVNCSDYSYHSAYLGAFRFIQQPEYEKLSITRDEWSNENVNCLRKWRMI